ncbi:MAG: gamma-glutamylcyclotransferase family protein [Brevinema sp.]
MEKRKYYIAYGSNLHIGQMKNRCPTAKIAGTGILKDFELIFRGNPYSAVATIQPKEGGEVPVAIWEIGKKDEKNLDTYEGYPTFYGKEDLAGVIGNEKENMMVYIMQKGFEAGVPSNRYYNTIKEGYLSFGFDLSVLDGAVELSEKSMIRNHYEANIVASIPEEGIEIYAEKKEVTQESIASIFRFEGM